MPEEHSPIRAWSEVATVNGETTVSRSHRVYWGSHGCKKSFPHAGACLCACGDYYEPFRFPDPDVYGEDAESAKSWSQRQNEKKMEQAMRGML